VKSRQKIRYIDSIFEKDDQGSYTDNALLLQDLLRYSLVINQLPLVKTTPFKLRELQNWIVRNNKQIVDYWNETTRRSKTPYSNRVHAMEGKINDRFEILQELNLIHQSGTAPAEKVSIQVSSYEYAKAGVLLALIIKSMNLTRVIAISKKKDEITDLKRALNKIYRDIRMLFKLAYKIRKDSPASEIFYSIFFQKCEDKRFFNKLINRMQHVLSFDYDIRSIPDLLDRAIHDPLFGRKPYSFIDLSHTIIQELNYTTQKLFLYRLKISLENRFQDKLEDRTIRTRKYERFRFRLRRLYTNCHRRLL